MNKAADPSPQASPEPRAVLLSLLKHLEAFILVREGHQQEYEEVMAAILVESRVTAPVGQPPIENIANIIAEHETSYYQRKTSWAWSCKCGVESPASNRESCVRKSQMHWAEQIAAALASPPQIAQPLNPLDCDCNPQHASHSFCRSKEPSRGMIPEKERVYPAAQPSQVSAEQFWKEWWPAEKQDLQWNSWKGIAIKFAEAYRAALAATPPQPPICPHCGIEAIGMNSNPDECLHKPKAEATLPLVGPQPHIELLREVLYLYGVHFGGCRRCHQSKGQHSTSCIIPKLEAAIAKGE